MMNGRQLSVVKSGKKILDNVSIDCPPGGVTVIMGRNGAGKSTLLRLLSGEMSPEAGNAYLDNRLLKDYSSKELANRRSVLAQSTHLAYPLRVREVVEMGCYNCYHQLTQRERDALVNTTMEKLKVTAFANRCFNTLSGGEQKRVLLTKCLTQLYAGRMADTHQYLLLDEPTAALDVEQQFIFLELATALAKEEGIGIIAVLHDLNQAARYADQVMVLKDGKSVTSGSVWQVFQPTILRSSFGVACMVQPHPHLNIPLITTYGSHYQSIENTPGRTENRAAQTTQPTAS